MNGSAAGRRADEPDYAAMKEDDSFRYQLRVRRSRLLGGGQYGSDAVTDARSRPGQSEMEMRRFGSDQDFTLTPNEEGELAVRMLSLDPASDEASDNRVDGAVVRMNVEGDNRNEFSTLMMALGVRADPLTEAHAACRAFVRALPGARGTRLESRWLPCDLVLAIGDEDSPKVRAPVELFEHLSALDFAGLTKYDMIAETGRLEIAYPAPDADLDLLLDDSPQTPAITRCPDPQRRVGTRLCFNARPNELAVLESGTNGVPTRAVAASIDDAVLVGGYDVFTLNPDTLAVDDDVETADDYVSHAQHKGRVRVLPRSLDGLEPAEIGDFEKLEVFYPSETRRIAPPPEVGDACRGDGKEAPGSQRRRARWFSAAESFVRFPRSRLRRSLMPAPDESLIAALLADGQTTAIRIALRPVTTEADQNLSDLPAAIHQSINTMCAVFAPDAEPKVTAYWRRNQGSSYVDFAPTGDRRVEPHMLRALLQTLSWSVPGTVADVDKDPLENAYRTWRINGAPEAEAHCFEAEVQLTAVVNGEARYSETNSFELHSFQHPVIADALEFLRFHQYGNAPGQIYRRYEVVLEAPPRVEASDLEAYMDKMPASADPHGWGVLRSMGLAAGLRLYDSEIGEYLRGKDLFERARDAFDRALRRYRLLPTTTNQPNRVSAPWATGLGQPFVDLVLRQDDLMSLTSFDGRSSGSSVQAERVRDSAAAAIVQLALRPVPDRWAIAPIGSTTDERPTVGYLLVSAAPEGYSDSIDFLEIKLPDALKPLAMFEVQNLASGVAAPATTTLIDSALADAIGLEVSEPTAAARIRTVDLEQCENGAPVMLVRVTVLAHCKRDGLHTVAKVWEKAAETFTNLGLKATWQNYPFAAPELDDGGPEVGDSDAPWAYDVFERFQPLNGPIVAASALAALVKSDRATCTRLAGDAWTICVPTCRPASCLTPSTASPPTTTSNDLRR